MPILLDRNAKTGKFNIMKRSNYKFPGYHRYRRQIMWPIYLGGQL